MTPKEKAKELIDKFELVVKITGTSEVNITSESNINLQKATAITYSKECALMCIDEIQEALIKGELNVSPYTTLEARQFYVKVKQEINRL